MNRKPKVLIVDDDEFNRDIMSSYLQEDGYEVILAEDGAIALEKLKEHPDVDIIALDRMMPNLDGMQVLEKIKSDSRLKGIPVIMQTAAALSEQVIQGIKAGVYYYLTKPYEKEMLLSIVKAAKQDAETKQELKTEVRQHKRVLGMMQQSRFQFRTLEEAQNLAYFIANCFPAPDIAVVGLSELLINAVEHGNLGITYAEKTKLIRDDTWSAEITRRLALPENITKFAVISFEATENIIKLHIKDQGAGFDCKQYLEMSADRATDPNGRGVAIAKMMSFHTIEYLGCGNEVVCTIKI